VKGPLSLRLRIALWFAVAVLCAAIVYAASAIGVYLLHERAEAAEMARRGLHDPGEAVENAAIVARLALGIALAAPVAAALAGGVGLWLAKKALAPMREAAERAAVARADRRELLLPIRGTDDEWDQLVAVVNELLAEDRRAMARIRAFSANAAHELRTPLTAMLVELQVTLRRERGAEEYRAALRSMESEVTRLTTLVNHLLMLARADSGELSVQPTLFDLKQVAAEAAAYVCALNPSSGPLIEVKGGPVGVMGHPLLSRRVLENLLENALRHGGKRVRVWIARENGTGTAAVVDDGPGVPLEVRARLFDRFNRLPGDAEGVGLGLAIAHSLAAAQGGSLRLEDGLPTRFVVGLPAADAPRRADP
jgi:signal transduction histidine kinase